MLGDIRKTFRTKINQITIFACPYPRSRHVRNNAKSQSEDAVAKAAKANGTRKVKPTMKLILTIITALFLTGCAQKVPEFEVAVKLTKRAETQLLTLKESIRVVAYLDGDGISLPWEHTAPFRDVYLGSFSENVNELNIAKFKEKTISSLTMKRLHDKNYFVTINVSSARKAVKGNILNCDVPIHHIQDIMNMTLEVQCDLLDLSWLKSIEPDRE